MRESVRMSTFEADVEHEIGLEEAQPVDRLGDLSDGFIQYLIATRRHLHRNPEIGNQEQATSAFIRAELERAGLRVHGPVAGTGLYVDIEGRGRGGAVGYRADIDALPSHDAKRVSYASQAPGAAHLCGHDAHTTMALGTALLLDRMRDRFPGMIRVFFQPNEESMPGGAPDMIEGGILEGLEAVYACHVDPSLHAGRFGLISGAATAAADQFRVVVRAGSSGHSARPHAGHDTVWIAMQIANTLYQLVGRVTDARNASILTLCRFNGGQAYNVIPSEVEFGGTLRATSYEDRQDLLKRIRQTAAHFGELYRVEVVTEVELGSPPVMNDARVVAHLKRTIRKHYGEEAIYRIPRPSMGAEDFAHYLEYVPGALLRVGTSSGPDTSYPLHDALFDIDEYALAPTSFLMAHSLAAHLRHNVLG